MEKLDLKRYRRILLVRYVLAMAAWLLMLGIFIYRITHEDSGDTGRASTSSLFCILHLILLRYPGNQHIRLFKALRDDAELRRAWNAEHDERYLQICAKAGIPLMSDTAIGLACIGFLVSIWESRIGAGMILASLIMKAVSTEAYDFWYKRLSQEEGEEDEAA